MQPKVLVVGNIPIKGLSELTQQCNVFFISTDNFDLDFIKNKLFQFDGMYIVSSVRLDKKILEFADNLKIVAVNGVGFDNIDLRVAKEKNIVVSNSPNSVTYPTAEMTIALTLAVSRKLYFYDNSLRTGKWIDVGQENYRGQSLFKKNLGIFGMGRIGFAVSKIAKSFGVNILYNSKTKLNEKNSKLLDAQYVNFNELIEYSDILSLHVPLNSSTKGVINKDVFNKMKRNAFLINVARGGLVVEKDLISALLNGQIAGAGLDVYEHEPNISQELLELDNVVLTPHAGTGTLEGRISCAKEASHNLVSFLIEGKPLNWVNK